MKKIISFAFILILKFATEAQTVGLITQTPGSLDGYVLFAPNGATTTYLIDKCGYKVHSWPGTHSPGLSAYFLEDGTLLRTGKLTNSTFNNPGGLGGIIEKIDWAGNITWSYILSDAMQVLHHDIRLLPNGNILAIAYELKSSAQAIAAGANPANIGTVVWSDKIVEIQPVGANGGNIVWEWDAWDHMVQDFDPGKANYGVVSDHPELININYNLGTTADWLHCNALDYNPALDQIILSSRHQSEFYIIDHSTTTLEASGHTGGLHGKGGDFLYRWGNPASYNRGFLADKKLFGQHNPRWIENGLPDSGNIMVFNNGFNRPAGNYSTVEIIAPPIDVNGNYSINTGQSFLPDSAYWSYQATPPTSFFSTNISGAQRLSNGNTLICEGAKGNFFEIDSLNNIVWKYINPVGGAGVIIYQGTPPSQNAVFRCTLYQPDYPGFNGFTLTPGNPIEINPIATNCNMLSGIIETDIYNNTGIFPNPFNSHIYFQSKTGNEKYKLSNCMGQVIYSGKNIEAHDFSFLPKGIYLLTILGNLTSTFKLVKQ